jgi:hypothetical protein
MYIFSILFISLQKLVNKPTKMKDTTSAIMFKVNKDVKDRLKQAAKAQSNARGYKVTMTALFAEWVASMPPAQKQTA